MIELVLKSVELFLEPSLQVLNSLQDNFMADVGAQEQHVFYDFFS